MWNYPDPSAWTLRGSLLNIGKAALEKLATVKKSQDELATALGGELTTQPPAAREPGVAGIAALVAPAKVLQSFEDITKNPTSLYGKSADEVAAILGEGWTKGSYGVTGTGWKFTKGDKIVFYHEGGRHVGPYYGYSSGTTGKVKIVGEGYKPLPGDKATIIHVPKE